jgi:hypothetical protein
MSSSESLAGGFDAVGSHRVSAASALPTREPRWRGRILRRRHHCATAEGDVRPSEDDAYQLAAYLTALKGRLIGSERKTPSRPASLSRLGVLSVGDRERSTSGNRADAPRVQTPA